jgi:hypothetical protein
MTDDHGSYRRSRAALLRVALLGTTIFACQQGGHGERRGAAQMTRFDWLASNSAPAGCPMEITSGAFIFPDGGSLYIPPKGLHAGWGNRVSIHVVGEDTKPLPDQMRITFFSYLENKFYEGTFPLPQALLTKLFSEGYRSFQQESGHDTYTALVAGVAPGGVVAVWASGGERQVEVFFGQAKEADLDWHATMGMPVSVERREFIASSLAEAAESDPLVKPMMERVPFGVWAEHRKRYRWRPVFEGTAPPERINRVHFFNGERDYLVLPLDAAAAQMSRPVPSIISFVDRRAGRSYRMTFDGQEAVSTFERLGAGNQPVDLVFAARARDGLPAEFEVLVRNATDTVPLRKVKRETFRAG